MSDTYSYEDLKTVIGTQYKAFSDFNASCIQYIQNVNKDNLKEYQEILAKQGKKGEFNLFEVIYPRWRHENFHSKMLKFFLENIENYPSFFDNFLVLINKKKNISKENYKDYTVQCEYPCKSGRIDVAIFSGNRKNVIIIENKLNWAGDQEKQIYKYYKAMTEKELEVDKIVYLSPSPTKEVSKNSLGIDAMESATKHEYIKDINDKLVPLIGFDGSEEGDLVSCLKKSLKECPDKNYWVFLNHYIEILKQTGVGDMTVIARKFLEEIQNSESKDSKIYEKLAYIKEMLDSISNERKAFWLHNFKGCGGNPTWTLAWKEYKTNDVIYYIDVKFLNLKTTQVIISHRYDTSPTDKKREYDDKLEKILDNDKELGKLTRGTHKDVLYKDFQFPTEDDVALKFVRTVEKAILSNL